MMGTANWQPKWWTYDRHGNGWDRVKEAMKRDWEQTKSDFKAGGRELDQDVDDTLKQAAGKDVIPPRDQGNAPHGTPLPNKKASWDDVEMPVRYGYGARQEFGSEHAGWDDHLEHKLKSEWESAKDVALRQWSDVKDAVRHGYERSRS